MSDYMYFGQLLGQSADEIRETVEDTLGLGVDEESAEHLVELGELVAMFDAALEEEGEEQSASMKKLAKNKDLVVNTRMQDYVRAQNEARMQRKEQVKTSNAKLIKNKAAYSWTTGMKSLADLGDMGSLLAGEDDGNGAGSKATSSKPSLIGKPGGAPSTTEEPKAPVLQAPRGSAFDSRKPMRDQKPEAARQRPPARPPPLAGPPVRGKQQQQQLSQAARDAMHRSQENAGFASLDAAPPELTAPLQPPGPRAGSFPDSVLEKHLKQEEAELLAEFESLLDPPVKPAPAAPTQTPAATGPQAAAAGEESPPLLTAPPAASVTGAQTVRSPAAPRGRKAEGKVSGSKQQHRQPKISPSSMTDQPLSYPEPAATGGVKATPPAPRPPAPRLKPQSSVKPSREEVLCEMLMHRQRRRQSQANQKINENKKIMPVMRRPEGQ